MIGNKIANKITKVSKSLQQNNLETGTNENEKEIPKEKYISPGERQEIIYKLRLKQSDNGISKNHKSLKNNHNKMIQRQQQMTKERYIFPE